MSIGTPPETWMLVIQSSIPADWPLCPGKLFWRRGKVKPRKTPRPHAEMLCIIIWQDFIRRSIDYNKQRRISSRAVLIVTTFSSSLPFLRLPLEGERIWDACLIKFARLLKEIVHEDSSRALGVWSQKCSPPPPPLNDLSKRGEVAVNGLCSYLQRNDIH